MKKDPRKNWGIDPKKSGFWKTTGALLLRAPSSNRVKSRGFPLILLTLAGSIPLSAQTPITDLQGVYAPGASSSYTEGGDAYDYGVVPGGDSGNDLFVTTFTIDIGNGIQTFGITNFADRIAIVRQDNPSINDGNENDSTHLEKQLLFYEETGTATNLFELRPSYEALMENALLNQIINRGTDNVFSNIGGTNLNNIERIDYIEDGGLTVPSDSAGEGFIILDRGGNDDVLIAAITSLDGNGDPDEWGPVVQIDNSTDWGQSSYSLITQVLAADNPGDNLAQTDRVNSQSISGVFVSYADLGTSTNDIIYGYSLAGGDANQDPVQAEWLDVSDAIRFPRNTSANSNDAGGLDLVAGGSIVSRTAFADLAVTKTVDNETPTTGDNVTFTLTAFNLGPFTSAQVTVTDQLPSGYTYVSHSASVGSYNSATGIWNIGTKVTNDPQTLEITATVNPTGNYNNVAVIASAITTDPQTENNTQERAVVPNAPPSNLTIQKTSDASGAVNHGDTVTYTIVVENTGGTEVSGVDVADVLPDGVTYTPGTLSATLNPPASGPQQITEIITTIGSGSFTVPTGVTELQVEAWGGGGSGAAATSDGNGGGGGGGAYARINTLSVTPGSNIAYFVGAGGALPGTPGNPGNDGGDTWFLNTSTLLAQGGTGAGQTGTIRLGGPGGLASTSVGDVRFSGGSGGDGNGTGPPSQRAGGGGGGSAFSNANGGDGIDGARNNPGDGGVGEGNGGDGGQAGTIQAQAGAIPGGGGGGCGSAGAGLGARGELKITYTLPGSLGTTSDPPGAIASGWTLAPGSTLTITFDVVLDNDAVVSEITNSATFTSDDDPVPVGDSVTDPVNGAAIESFVWNDLNGNGTQDSGETGIFNVTVNLLDSGGSPVLDPSGDPVSATTNFSGLVGFAGLPPGDYILEFDTTTLPANFVLTEENADSAGPGGSINSDANIATGRTASVTLTAGQTLTTYDAGAYGEPSITGSVDGDTTGDGSGDTPQSGVTVELLDASGTTVLATTTTNASGNYSFTGLTPGNYRVRQTPPTGFTEIADVDGGDFTVIGDQALITLLSGDNRANQDFVNRDDALASGTISGLVEIDTTNDGNGDTPQQGIEVELRDDQGDLLQTTVTASDGSYSFTVSPGDYQIVQSLPVGFEAIDDVDGGDLTMIGDQSLITVAANDNISDQSFTNSQFGVVTAPELCLSLNGTLGTDFPRIEDLPDNVTYFIEYATSLGNPTTWNGTVELTTGNTSTVTNGDGTETVTINDIPTLTGLTGGVGFVRLRIELDADEDSTADEIVTSLVSGWLESDFGVECRSYNNPFLSCPPLRAAITNVNSSDLTLDTNADVLTPGVDYYIEVLDGTGEGQRFDVASTSGTTVTVDTTNDLCTLAAPYNTTTGNPSETLSGSNIVIRAHKTLDSLFPTDQFTATNDPDTADQITLYDGSTILCYWLYDDGVSPRWVLAGDAGLADRGGVIVPPGHGVWVNSQSSKTLLSYGQVRDNDFIRPLCQGINHVGGGYPIDQSAVSRDYTTGSGFTGHPDYVQADQFLIWNGDNIAGRQGYLTHYLSDFYSPERWIKAADIFRTDVKSQNLFIRDRAVLLDLQTDNHGFLNTQPWSAD